MSWQLRFTPLAEADIAEAYDWYEAARSGLGEELLHDVQRALDFVVAYPNGCPEVHRALRRALLHRFPYSLYYRLIDGTEIIEVRAFVHQSRRPQHWRRRA